MYIEYILSSLFFRSEKLYSNGSWMLEALSKHDSLCQFSFQKQKIFTRHGKVSKRMIFLKKSS